MLNRIQPKRRTWLLALAGLGLLLSQLACDLSMPGETPELTSEPVVDATQEPAGPSRTPAPPTPTRTPIPTRAKSDGVSAAAPGMACMGSSGYGVTCLDESGWHVYNSDNSPLPSDYIQHIASCPDGRLLIVHSSGISAFDGRTWKEYEGGWGYSSPEAVACSETGEFWVAHFRGASYFDGANWTTFGSENLATGSAASDLIDDVAIAPNGTVWVVAVNSVASYDGAEWTIFQEGQGLEEKYFFDQVEIDHQGRPWVAHSGGLMVYEDGAWTQHQNLDISSVESMAIDHQDRVWVGTLTRGLYIFEGGGWLIYDTSNSELGSDFIQAITVDALGWVWVGTEWGLYIVDGDLWTTYRMDNSGLADHDIEALGIVAGGPTLPAAQDKPAGSMRGSIVSGDGRPFSSAMVEICIGRVSSSFYGDTPCSGEPYVRSSRTDKGGNFEFADLPAGFYAITVDTGDGWAQLTTDLDFMSERILVQAGEETYLPDLVIGDED